MPNAESYYVQDEGGSPESGIPESDAASANEGASSAASESSADTLSADLKALANQGVYLDLGGPSAPQTLDNAEEPEQGRAHCSCRLVLQFELISVQATTKGCLSFNMVGFPSLRAFSIQSSELLITSILE